MLIRILIAPQLLPALAPMEVSGLENLGSAAFFGQHLVVADRLLLAELAKDGRLSMRARAAFSSAHSKAAEFDAALRVIDRRVEVRLDLPEPRKVGALWEVPLRAIGEALTKEAPELLAEHIHDAQLFLEFGRWYRWHSHFRAMGFFGVPVGAGGSATHTELRNRVGAHKRFVLCVVDSDREYPGGRPGETARKCQGELPHELWFAQLYVLEAREAENILPVRWLGETQTGRQNSDAIEQIRCFDAYGLSFMRRHTDLKEGFRACDYVHSTSVSVSDSACLDLQKLPAHLRARACGEARACSDDHACIAVGPLGGTLVAQVHEWLTTARPDFTNEIVDDSELRLLAKEIFEWGLAAQKIRA
jgi:hypothetical protein